MSDQTTSEGGALEADFMRVRQAMVQMTRMLGLLEEDVLNGDARAVKEAGKLLAEIRAWSRVAIETEARLNDYRKQQDGVVQNYALDLEKARHQIGCRMARLRRCCRSGKIPE